MALAPVVPMRRPGLGAVSVAASVSPVSLAVSGAESLISSIASIGDQHKYGQANYEGAEQSRAQTYLYGIAAGSVRAGQLLLGQHQTDTSTYAQNYTSSAISQANAKYPTIMAQATAAGPIHDSADGYQGLLILASLNIPYSFQYAGYSTDSGLAPAGATLTTVTQLQALVNAGHAQGAPVSGLSSILSGTGVTGTGLNATLAGVPLWLAGGLIVAWLVTRKTKSVPA